MDFDEKARIRMEHWLSHSDQHQQEYEKFADELEQAGKADSAAAVRGMAALEARSAEYLRKALEALGT
jgi:hypothetical protein